MFTDRYFLGQRQKTVLFFFVPTRKCCYASSSSACPNFLQDLSSVLLRFRFRVQCATPPTNITNAIYSHHPKCVFWPKVNVYQCESTYLQLLGRIASEIPRPLREILVYGLLGLLFNIITSDCEQVTKGITYNHKQKGLKKWKSETVQEKYSNPHSLQSASTRVSVQW